MTRHITLAYKSFNGTDAQADITVIPPGVLPDWVFPGHRIVVIGEPSPPYDGLSVTNGAELIATALMRQYGIFPMTGPTIYIEYYPRLPNLSEGAARDHHYPTLDVVLFRWEVAQCRPPYKIEARLDENEYRGWLPLPKCYWPYLLTALGAGIPDWVREEAFSVP